MVAIALLCLSHRGLKPAEITATQVIRRMEDMYARLRSYSDTGVYTSGRTRITFKTFYKAPGKMYFEFTNGAATYYFCAGGKRGVPPPFPDLPRDKDSRKPTWLADAYINGEVERDSLELEIAGFTGVSRSTAYNIPTMLFPEAGGRRFHDQKGAQIAGKERVGSEVCYVIKGEDQTLWVGTHTFTLYKLEEPSGSRTETTTYLPKLNPRIADGQFVFRRPPASRAKNLSPLSVDHHI